MEKRIAHRKTGKVLAAAAAAAGLAGFGATKADASLIIDVRATGSSDSGATVSSKSVSGLQVGDVVSFGVFAQISGTNGINDETVATVAGSFSSGSGGLLGNLSSLIVAPFNQLGYQNGAQSDFDSDGDLDIGSLGTASANKFVGRANPAATGSPIDSNTSEVQVGTLTFTVTGGSGSATVSFIPRTNLTAAAWNEDGVATVKNLSTGTYAAGAPVAISAGGSVPEPASIGLLGLASVGLLARRRDKKA